MVVARAWLRCLFSRSPAKEFSSGLAWRPSLAPFSPLARGVCLCLHSPGVALPHQFYLDPRFSLSSAFCRGRVHCHPGSAVPRPRYSQRSPVAAVASLRAGVDPCVYGCLAASGPDGHCPGSTRLQLWAPPHLVSTRSLADGRRAGASGCVGGDRDLCQSMASRIRADQRDRLNSRHLEREP
jgi:hypothetical protein